MKRLLVGLVAVWMMVGLSSSAQPQTVFKLGTFERAGKTFVGVVLRDALVIDFAEALAARPASSRIRPPGDMKDLIARYDAVRPQILEVVGQVEQAGAARPPYVFDVKDVRIRPPVMYPTTMLNVAVNYREHAQEIAGREATNTPPGATAARTPPGGALPGTTSASGIWERAADDTRWNPYMFIKLPSAVIAAGEPIRLPPAAPRSTGNANSASSSGGRPPG